MMRNFDITFDTEQGIGMMQVGDFINFDEAYVYCRNLYDDPEMARRLSGIKPVIITRRNLETLLQHYSFNEYQEFYDEHFLNIPEFDIDGGTLYEEYESPETDEAPATTDNKPTEEAEDGQN